MGSDAIRHYGAKGRQDVLMFDPDDLILVTDKSHPLYDERVHDPVDENMVKNVMVHGIIEPVIVRRNGEKNDVPQVEIVAGRQRVKWARAANKLLAKEGKQLIRVPATTRRGDGGDLMGVMITENEGRHGDGPLVRAAKLQRFINMGRTEEDAALMFCKSVAAVRDLLALLDCDATVQKAVEQGTIGATLAARQLSRLPRDEQKAELQRMIASGATRGNAAQEHVRAARNGSAPPAPKKRMRSRPTIEKWLRLLKKVDRSDAAVARAVLGYVLGNDKALGDLHESLSKAAEAAQ
jgi:ParB family transcriptional regulator, chromosome partitioning protein